MERSALAQDDLPDGKFGVVSGLRQNIGSLGDSFGLGWLLGIEAGYQPGALGASWEVLWGQFAVSDPEIVDSSLGILEMNFGLRLRRIIGAGEPRFAVATAGVTVLRTAVPIPPDGVRNYVGPYLGLGIDQYLFGRYLITFEARYGVLFNGPQSLSLVASFAFGS